MDVGTLYDKGFTHISLGEWDNADSCYDGILKIDPNHAGAIGDKGVVQASKGNYQEALDYFNKALKIDSKNKRILKNKQSVLEKLKESMMTK